MIEIDRAKLAAAPGLVLRVSRAKGRFYAIAKWYGFEGCATAVPDEAAARAEAIETLARVIEAAVPRIAKDVQRKDQR
jgi:hypothetical protein